MDEDYQTLKSGPWWILDRHQRQSISFDKGLACKTEKRP